MAQDRFSFQISSIDGNNKHFPAPPIIKTHETWFFICFFFSREQYLKRNCVLQVDYTEGFSKLREPRELHENLPYERVNLHELSNPYNKSEKLKQNMILGLNIPLNNFHMHLFLLKF